MDLNIDIDDRIFLFKESETASSPSYTALKASDMKTYGSMPIEEDIVVVQCKVCSKPILASNFAHHKG